MSAYIKYITATFCSTVALVVLSSWYLNISIFKISTIEMNPLTACLFFICGLSLASTQRLRVVFALIILFLAVIKLLSFSGIDFEIDQILFFNEINLRKIPNRMAPYTAVNFVFVAFSLLFFDLKIYDKHLVSNYLVLPPIIISLTGTVGHFYSNLGFAQFGSFIPMANHTAVTFLVFGLGVLLHHRNNGLLKIFFKQNPSSVSGRHLLPYLLILPTVLGWVLVQLEYNFNLPLKYGIGLMAIIWTLFGTLNLWFLIRTINHLEMKVEIALKKESENKLNRLKKFFPASLAEMIASGEIEDPFKWRRRDITVVFIDIRGFTAFTEQEEPEVVMQMLQTYYSIVGKVAQRYNGTIGHLAGDGVMIFFNAPIAIEEPQFKAVEMALDIRSELGSLWVQFNDSESHLDFGAGIASGYTVVGGIGEEGFWDYTVIGSTTNVASRLCSVAKDGQILVSHRFLCTMGKPILAEHIGQLELKGLKKTVNAFNIKSVKVSLRDEAEGQFNI